MPVKQRLAKDRLPQFSAEAVSLFVELERTPHSSQKFKEGSRKLAHLLDLVAEFWTGNHVNNRDRKPCHPPWCIAYNDFFRVRAVREELLAATGERRAGPEVTHSETIM